MKLNEFVRSLPTWTNLEEKNLLEKIDQPTPINSFTDHEQFVIECLVRKSLIIKVESKGVVYIYPNV